MLNIGSDHYTDSIQVTQDKHPKLFAKFLVQ